eukprot:CAMPEP_0170060616 /NCGR_PEP_ID=MMETSP0019_2-20121128/2494_1 /TAXON_ID=98059 /ORGANISM="Dinobryon sp., Strain UTEXLB2267" /LENGTH=181 /DNA_ID=CAMNT_0010266245 /DNA_START=864 /DNA_END=1409 /DNA_ORIENTATION=-
MMRIESCEDPSDKLYEMITDVMKDIIELLIVQFEMSVNFSTVLVIGEISAKIFRKQLEIAQEFIIAEFVQACKSSAAVDTIPPGFLNERAGRKRARKGAMDLARSRMKKEYLFDDISDEDKHSSSKEKTSDGDSVRDSVEDSVDEMMHSFEGPQPLMTIERERKLEKIRKMVSFKGFGKKS